MLILKLELVRLNFGLIISLDISSNEDGYNYSHMIHHEQLQKHLRRFIVAYHFAKHFKAP